MEQFPRVFLEVDAGDAATARLAFDVEFEVTVATEGQVILRDLVALGQVGIEVILAVELGEFRNLAVQGERGPDRALDRAPVDHGERTRQAEAHGAGVRVWGGRQVIRRARAEHLALRQHLGVDLEADHDFVACRDGAHAAARMSGDCSLRKSAAVSKA